jgi:hypothetical protein
VLAQRERVVAAASPPSSQRLSSTIADRKDIRREARVRRDKEREEQERRRRRNGYVVAGALVAATIGVLAFVLFSGGDDKPSASQLRTLSRAAAAAGCTLRTFPSEGRTHTTKLVTYKTNPPTSGPHDPVPAPDGEYANGAPPKERYVHALEHGRIELQYRPDASPAARAGLKAVFDQDRDRMLLFPNNTGMPYEVAATAWTHLLGCPHYNPRVPAALRAFRDAYRGKAPAKIP